MKLENEAISNEFFCEGTAKLIKTIWVMRVINLLFFMSLLIIWNTPSNLELKSKKAFVLIYVIYVIFFMIEREIGMKKIVKLYDEKILPKFGKRILKTIKYTNNGKIGINRYQDSGLFKNKKRVDFE